MSNLKTSQQTLETTTLNSKRLNTIKSSMALAFERTNTPIFNIDNLTKDISSEFKNRELSVITKAIRNGSLGAYGRTYKLSTQEVCIWIREYIKENKNKVSPENWQSNPWNDEDN